MSTTSFLRIPENLLQTAKIKTLYVHFYSVYTLVMVLVMVVMVVVVVVVVIVVVRQSSTVHNIICVFNSLLVFRIDLNTV